MRICRGCPPKSLKDVARYLAGDVAKDKFGVDEQVLADLAAWNAPDDVIEAATKAARDNEDFEVCEDIWPSVCVFQRMQTQWRTRGMEGEISGLDYTIFPRILRSLKIPRAEHDQVFDDLYVLETETLRVMQERR